MESNEHDEEALGGGHASGRVVRVGDTVRKPWLASSERTTAYMRALRQRGVDVPEPRGRDGQGRQVVEFVPGRLASYDAPPAPGLIRAAGALVRTIHDASVGLPLGTGWDVLLPTEAPDLLCHHDLATWNLVVDGDRLVFIDWDGAGPSTRLWDLAYAAISFGHLFPGADPEAEAGPAAARLADFVDGYGADAALRTALPDTMARRAAAMRDLLARSHAEGREPWATMHVGGHGRHWARTATFVAEHRETWTRVLAPEAGG